MSQPIWTFFEFQTVGGRGVITEWAEGLTAEAEDDFYGLLRNLAVTTRRLWVRPVYGVFGPDIGEIRFKANNLQHRVFGCFLAEAGQYALLVGATKKGRNYSPRDAIDTARRRQKLIQNDRSQLREYQDHKIEDV
ncbi:MAG: Phage derived protein Gp49-like [Blastocatellia bacterium]|jgi:hypothetical protein|nr:Phage derived protein Gp49-like [Blastocatellia bacterium]